MMKKICVVVPLLLLLLPVVCGQVADIITDTLIHYTQMISWKDAQAFCRQHHIDLISIKNREENSYSPQGWIGLHRDGLTSPWKWSRGDQIANFTSWAIGEPSLTSNCAYKQPNALTWATHGCDVNHTFTCYNMTLILVKHNKTWEEALHHCRAIEAVDPSRPATEYNNNRYDLISLITDDDYVNTRKKIQEATTDEVWTGLRFLAGEWLWMNGETMQNKDFQSCPTEGFCGILVKNSTAQVKTSHCEQRKNFVCYRKP